MARCKVDFEHSSLAIRSSSRMGVRRDDRIACSWKMRSTLSIARQAIAGSAWSVALDSSRGSRLRRARFLAVGAQLRQGLDGRSRLLFRETQLVQLLQVQPEFRAGTEKMCQPQSGITGYCAISIEDVGDTIGWHSELPRKFRRAHVQLFELLGKVFAGMDCCTTHK